MDLKKDFLDNKRYKKEISDKVKFLQQFIAIPPKYLMHILLTGRILNQFYRFLHIGNPDDLNVFRIFQHVGIGSWHHTGGKA